MIFKKTSKPLTIFDKISILVAWIGSELASDACISSV